MSSGGSGSDEESSDESVDPSHLLRGFEGGFTGAENISIDQPPQSGCRDRSFYDHSDDDDQGREQDLSLPTDPENSLRSGDEGRNGSGKKICKMGVATKDDKGTRLLQLKELDCVQERTFLPNPSDEHCHNFRLSDDEGRVQDLIPPLDMENSTVPGDKVRDGGGKTMDEMGGDIKDGRSTRHTRSVQTEELDSDRGPMSLPKPLNGHHSGESDGMDKDLISPAALETSLGVLGEGRDGSGKTIGEIGGRTKDGKGTRAVQPGQLDSLQEPMFRPKPLNDRHSDKSDGINKDLSSPAALETCLATSLETSPGSVGQSSDGSGKKIDKMGGDTKDYQDTRAVQRKELDGVQGCNVLSKPSNECHSSKGCGLEISVGSSVIQWQRKQRGEAHCNLGGCIAIQRGRGQTSGPPSLVVGRHELKGGVTNYQAREGTLESRDDIDPHYYASVPPPNTEKNSMIDCVIIFDPVKKCHVLEVIEATITKSTDLDGLEAFSANNPDGHFQAATAIRANPRLETKQAECQLRKLKRKKGVAKKSIPTSKPKKKLAMQEKANANADKEPFKKQSQKTSMMMEGDQKRGK